MAEQGGITLNLKHLSETLKRLLAQFHGQPNMEGIMASYATQVQETEDMIWGLLTERMIPDAVGVQLDLIGTIVGEARKGRTDDEYRVALQGVIATRRLNARIEDMIEIVKVAVADPAAVIRVVEFFPAGIEIHLDSPTVEPEIGREIGRVVERGKGGGIGFRFYWRGEDPRFRYAPGGATVPASPNGYNNGEYAGVTP